MLRVVSADHILGVRSAVLQQLLVLAHRGVAVGIERIENVTELHEMVALPRAFHGPERRWYRGLALVEGKILPVVNAAAFTEAPASVTPTRAASASAGRQPEVKARV
jgi:chemotaxis signal transduction protein